MLKYRQNHFATLTTYHPDEQYKCRGQGELHPKSFLSNFWGAVQNLNYDTASLSYNFCYN